MINELFLEKHPKFNEKWLFSDLGWRMTIKNRIFHYSLIKSMTLCKILMNFIDTKPIFVEKIMNFIDTNPKSMKKIAYSITHLKNQWLCEKY